MNMGAVLSMEKSLKNLFLKSIWFIILERLSGWIVILIRIYE